MTTVIDFKSAKKARNLRDLLQMCDLTEVLVRKKRIRPDIKAEKLRRINRTRAKAIRQLAELGVNNG